MSDNQKRQLREHYATRLPDLLPVDSDEELQTFCAIAIELMRISSPSALRIAAQNVEIRHHIRRLSDE